MSIAIDGLGARIRAIRTGRDESQESFAVGIGVSQGFLSDVERGKKVPGSEFLASLRRYTGVSIDALLDSDMQGFPIPTVVREQVAAHIPRTPASPVWGIPMYLSPVSAGQPTPAGTESPAIFDCTDLVPTPESYFVVRVAGDSMIGAGIRYGDYAFVDRSAITRRGDIVVAVLDGETVLKRWEVLMDRVFLYPENERYTPIDITDRETVVQGVVKAILRRL